MFCDITFINGKKSFGDGSYLTIQDFGVLFGFGVYESILVYNGQAVSLSSHLSRIKEAVEYCGFTRALDVDLVLQVNECIKTNQLRFGQILIFITHGQNGLDGSVLVLAKRFLHPINTLRSLSVKLLPEFRGSFSFLKLMSCAPSLLTKKQLTDQGFDEAIMFSDSFITEALSCAVCIVSNGEIVIVESPKKTLTSISIKNLCKLFDKHQISYSNSSVTLDEMFSGQEIWLLSTTWGLRVVKELQFKDRKYEYKSSLAEKVFTYYINMLDLQEF